MIVVPLGIASATPTAIRHLPSVALWREGSVFLFDCGENAQMCMLQAGLKRSKIANQRVEIFKPQLDTRYDDTKVVSHDSNYILSTPIEHSSQLLKFFIHFNPSVALIRTFKPSRMVLLSSTIIIFIKSHLFLHQYYI